MAITGSTVTANQSLEEFRVQFNNLVSDVSQLESNPTYGSSLIFEGSKDDAFETTIQEFVDNNKDDKVSQKINDDILVKTNEIEKENNNKVKKDQKQTPIQAYRIATMGRFEF